MESQNEQRIAMEILRKIRRLDLPLKLDEITEGRGNCFPLAVLAQCRRVEIFRELNKSIQNIIRQNYPTLPVTLTFNCEIKRGPSEISNT